MPLDEVEKQVQKIADSAELDPSHIVAASLGGQRRDASGPLVITDLRTGQRIVPRLGLNL